MTRSSELSAMDLVVLAGCVLAGGALMVFPFAVAPPFGGMYRDFAAALPWATRLALAPWPAPALGVLVVGAAVVAFRREHLVQRRVGLAASALGAVLAIGALAYALYLPLFELTGRISAE